MDRIVAMFVKKSGYKIPTEIMHSLKRIRQLANAVRLRLSLQRALQSLVVTATVCMVVLAIMVLLLKWGMIDELWVVASGWISAGALVCALTIASLRRPSAVRAAMLLDEAGGFNDRLSNALAFSSNPSPTAMMQLAMSDAETVLSQAEPSRAAPWAFPEKTGRLLLASMALGLAAWVEVPPPLPPATETVVEVEEVVDTPEKKEILLAVDKERLIEEKNRLEEELKGTQDPQLKAWLADLNELLRELAKGTLTPKEAFARMGKLRRAKEGWEKKVGEGLKEIKNKLSKAAQKRHKRSQKDMKALRKALEESRLKAAAKALDSLADKLQRKAMKRKDRQRLGKELKELANTLKSERNKRIEKLKRDRDRLKKKKKRKKDRFAKRDRDRLKKNKRELDRLRRQQQQQSEARRNLDRLQRSLSKAAQDMLRRMKKNAQSMSPEDMRKAAEMLRRLSKQNKTQQRMKMAEAKLVDIKEMLRRGGQKGKDGKGGKNGKMKRFLARAQGKDGKQGKGQKAGGKEQKMAMLKPGGKGGKSLLLGPAGKTKMPGSGGMGKEKGEGMGEGHDPNVLGEKSKLNVRYKEDQVQGREGKGESKSRVVYSAATKGFSSRSYRRVHQDYSEVVEEKMERQEVPAGKRRYVRRYFDLIRPR
jgi:hypothetical protein